MPLHGYTTDNRPPTNADHLLAHPYSIALSAWQILGGAATLASTLWDFQTSQSLQRLPQAMLAVVGALLIFGGIFVIRGLLNDDSDLMAGWRTERTGLVFSATAWGAYSITIIVAFPGSILTWSLGLTFAIANLTRLRATQLEEKRVRARISQDQTN